MPLHPDLNPAGIIKTAMTGGPGGSSPPPPPGRLMVVMLGMVLIFGMYGLYIGSHALTGQPIPDGVVFAGATGSILAGFGYVYGRLGK